MIYSFYFSIIITYFAKIFFSEILSFLLLYGQTKKYLLFLPPVFLFNFFIVVSMFKYTPIVLKKTVIKNQYLTYKMNPKCTMMLHIGIMNNMRLDLRTSKTPFTKKESIKASYIIYLFLLRRNRSKNILYLIIGMV